MTRTRPMQNAFSSGEIAPLLYSRADYQRFQTGMRTCRGFIPLRQGGFTRAPGTEFKGNTRQDQVTRLVPFEFSQNDALVLLFSDLKLRFMRYGQYVEKNGSIYEIDTPYREQDLPNLKWAQSADALYIVDGVHPMQRLARSALDNWAIADAKTRNGPFGLQNLDETKTLQASAETGTITLTSSPGLFDASWVGELVRLEPNGYPDIPLWTGNTAASVGTLMRYDRNIYRLTVGANTGVNPPIHSSGVQKVNANPGTTWEFVSDGVGIVKIVSITSPTEAVAEVVKTLPPPVVSTETYRWSRGAWSSSRGYPSAIQIHGQSMWLGFTASQPRGVWSSSLGDYLDFEPSAEADGSFGYTLSGSRSRNEGKWLHSARKGIYIGAAGEAYRGFSTNPNQRIGPTTLDTDLEGEDGCSSASPISPYGYPIFISKDKRRLFELRYSFEQEGGVPIELSLPSEHIGKIGFEEIVWQSSPDRLGWLRLSSGDLAVMLYDPKEDVLGWSIISLAGGLVESLVVTPSVGGTRDVVTMVVQRFTELGQQRCIEELSPIFSSFREDLPAVNANHLFSAVDIGRFDSGNTLSTTIPHLAGKTVYAWSARGASGPHVLGAAGEIELDYIEPIILVGLHDPSHEAETLPIQVAARDGSSAGRHVRAHSQAGVRVHRTSGGSIAVRRRALQKKPRDESKKPILRRSVGAAIETPQSGLTAIDLSSGHDMEVSLVVTPEVAAPLTITALIPEVEEVSV